LPHNDFDIKNDLLLKRHRKSGSSFVFLLIFAFKLLLTVAYFCNCDWKWLWLDLDGQRFMLSLRIGFREATMRLRVKHS